MPHTSSCLLALCAMLLGLPALEALEMTARFAKQWRLSKVTTFSWSQCDDLPHPGKIESLSVSPDPIGIPGDLNVAAVGSTSLTLDTSLKLALTMEKKVVGLWVKVPCVDNIGSCTYDNVCDILDSLIPPGQPCPEPLHTYGIPCHCPFKAGRYSLPNTTFYVPDVPMPSWLENGNYRVKSTVSTDQGEVGCVTMELTLKSQLHHWWK